MKRLFYLLVLLIPIPAPAQDTPLRSFDNLKKSKLPNAGIDFWYNPATTTIYDLPLKDSTRLPEATKEDIRYITEDDYYGFNGYLVAKTRITPSEECYVFYIASWDQGFLFCRPRTEKPLGALWPHGLLVVPGNGTVYTRYHLDTFTASEKYEIAGDTIVEVTQPYHYIGLKSKTLKEVRIYDGKEKKKRIATVPPNHEIEILLTDDERPSESWKRFYLVRTSFGLCGWAELEYGQQESVDVEGLFYNGD